MNTTNESIRTDDVLTYALSSERNATQDIEFTVGRSLKRKKIQVYAGLSTNMEAWCIMHISFQNLVREWQITAPADEFSLYALHLDGSALTAWQLLLAEAPEATDDNFTTTVETFIQQMSAQDLPRDMVCEYLTNSQNTKKPRNASVVLHHRRLTTLFKYHDMLPGTVFPLSGSVLYRHREMKLKKNK